MNKDILIHKLQRQLLIERICIGVAVFIFGVWSFCGHVASSKRFIVVDGKPVVCVGSERDAREVLSGIKNHSGCDPSEIEFRQDVVIARAPHDVRPVSRHKAMRAVRGMVSPVVPKWAILVDGQPVVAVPSRTAAGHVLEKAKLKYGNLARNLVEEPQFKEKVTVDIVPVDPAIYRSTAQSAVDFIFQKPRPTSLDAEYVVRKGDLASTIAARHGLRLPELMALNVGINPHRLQIGDRIRVKKTQAGKAKLTIVVRDQSDRTESIPPPVQRVSSTSLYVGKSYVISPGASGRRRVKVATIYENGAKVGSEIIEEEILRDPVPRRVAEGIKPR